MARYSVELHEIVNNGVNIFDFTYPIYDETHKEDLEQLIIDTYFFREIGFETVGRFKHYLKVKMRQIMPTYNKMYKAIEETHINILSNSKGVSSTKNTATNATTQTDEATNTQTVDNEGTIVNASTGSVGVVNSDLKLKSDTPQGALDIEETEGKNVTNIEKESGNTTTTNDSTNTTTNDLLTTTANNSNGKTVNDSKSISDGVGESSGYSGITEIELLEKYTQKIINVDNMIIDDLSELFMQIY